MLSREPSAWSLASNVLAEIAAAKNDEDLAGVLRLRGAAVAKLPPTVGGVLSACYNQRRKALAPVSLAAGFERELRAAADIPALDEIVARVADAFNAGTVTREEMAQLSRLQGELETAMERDQEQAA